MEKFSYQLTTLSSLIISPRQAVAFYADLEEFSSPVAQERLEILKEQDSTKQDSAEQNSTKQDATEQTPTKLKVIYPFYQYGMYSKYDPDNAEYYLPGSSIKGALCQGATAVNQLMVDDISIPKECIVLRNLYKAQYLDSEPDSCLKVFFERVGVEMIRAEAVVKGEFYLANKASAEALLREANQSALCRMKQMQKYLEKLIAKLQENSYNKKLENELNQVKDNLTSLLNDKNVFLLGGFKGLLHAMEVKEPIKNEDSSPDITSAVYLDLKTMLPHGLVKIELQT